MALWIPNARRYGAAGDLGGQIGVDTLPIVKGESAVQIAKRAKQQPCGRL